ncbi:MAG: AmmeMemoRadiSam system protein B [Deltaproteobacteria bacterium]|nr:AmmeMemoRadiSam system protein B [Deltaproteobacteria bacterium]
MDEILPALRRDLEFFPVQNEGKQFILIRDPLGLVQEGRAVAVPLYQFMILLDGRRTIRDIQIEMIRQQGGILIGIDDLKGLFNHLDESFLVDSDRFKKARDGIVQDFCSAQVRPCSHCGRAYPADPALLGRRLDEILAAEESGPVNRGKPAGLVAPHIDFNVGFRVYSRAYQTLRDAAPSRVVILGVGHRMGEDLFSLTEKDFETPLGVARTDRSLVQRLRKAGGDAIAPDDFVHRTEHSIEFQVVFLQHILGEGAFTIIPVLCGFFQVCLREYSREAYLESAGPFLDELRRILAEGDEETLLVAGVDFSHIGPKFGHDETARQLERQAALHDRALLECLSRRDSLHFWEESRRVEDRFNVCGFSALACLLEVLPRAEGHVLDYQTWHEEPTRSAVSFAAMSFTH